MQIPLTRYRVGYKGNMRTEWSAVSIFFYKYLNGIMSPYFFFFGDFLKITCHVLILIKKYLRSIKVILFYILSHSRKVPL